MPAIRTILVLVLAALSSGCIASGYSEALAQRDAIVRDLAQDNFVRGQVRVSWPAPWREYSMPDGGRYVPRCRDNQCSWPDICPLTETDMADVLALLRSRKSPVATGYVTAFGPTFYLTRRDGSDIEIHLQPVIGWVPASEDWGEGMVQIKGLRRPLSLLGIGRAQFRLLDVERDRLTAIINRCQRTSHPD